MNQEDLNVLWEIASNLFCSKYGQQYAPMLKKMEIFKVEDGVCYIHATDQAIIDEIKKMQDELKDELNKVFVLKGIKVDVEIRKEIAPEEVVMEYVDTSEDDEEEETGLRPSLTLDSFVVGKNSEFTYSVCEAILNSIVNGKYIESYNPTLIFGDSGLGKTHLAQAVGNELLKKCPDKKVKYLTAEQFNNQYLDAIRKGGFKNSKDNISRSSNFRQKYRNLDLIIIDDIQFFERVFGKGEGSVEEEFFNTFNALTSKEKQIIFISDRLPKDIKNLSNRIKNRIGSGISAQIKRPDFSTRVAILQSICEANGQKIENNVLEYIADNVTESVRDMEGILKTIIAHASLLGRTINIDIVKDAVERQIERTKSLITADSIVEKVSLFYDLKESDIKSDLRKKEILIPRQVCMYIIKDNLDISLDAIGKVFNRDHSTVHNAIEKIRGLIQEDDKLKSEIKEIVRSLKE